MDLTNITFKEIVSVLKAVKSEYKRGLLPFSIYEIKEETMYIYNWRKKIYELNLLEWRKDLIWEYLNDDVEYELLQKLSGMY
jgi:hypothetical protein